MNEGDERIRRSELESHVDQILPELPARCQEIFLLSRRDQLTNDEISDRLGISKRSVENQLTRALKHLRNHAKSLTVCAILFFTLLLSSPVFLIVLNRSADRSVGNESDSTSTSRWSQYH